MPERSGSAFVLRRGAQAPSIEGGVRVSERSSLGELEADQQKVRAFEFYVGKITSGQITSADELKARLNQRFEANFDENGYLAAEDGTGLKNSAGRSIRIQPEEKLAISDPKDQQVLLELYEGFGTAQSEREAVQQEVTALNFYVNKILSGGVLSSNELRARLNQRFVISGGKAILASEDNPPKAFPSSIPGKPLEIEETERFKVTDLRQQELLLELYQDFTTTAVNEGQQARGFDFYVGKILSGQITSSNELRARLNQRIRAGYTEAGLIEDENGELFEDPNSDGYIQLGQGERFRVVDSEEQQFLLKLYDLTSNSAFPTEIRSLIGLYAQTGRSDDLNRLRNLLEEKRGISKDETERFVEDLSSQRRRASLKIDFYDSLSDQNTATSFGILDDFDSQNDGDTSLVSRLRIRALEARRVKVVRDFSAILAGGSSGNFDQALLIANALFRSETPQDRRCALILSETLYRLELATFKDQIREMISVDVDPQSIYLFIDGLPARPPLAGLDYIQAQLTLKENIGTLFSGIGQIKRLKDANQIRSEFSSPDVSGVLTQIEGLADETQEEIGLKSQLFTLYKSFIATNKPDVFDQRFAKEIIERIEGRLKEVFINPDLGRNKEAFKYLKGNFDIVFRPLLRSFEDDPRTKKEVKSILGSKDKKLKFVQKLSELEKQRPLTDIERSYIQSVELLSLFNPYLLALLEADPAVTSEYLQHHFDSLSRKTVEQLQDGSYVPLLQVGTGPNGLAALGEVVRNNPGLASQMLIIDSGEQPGGPFAVPRGPAWKLNSANKRGEGGFVLPALPNGNELKTVRAYGSPFRWYPGERVEGSSVRFGSINTTVDYLLTPDVLSFKNYPTNEELQIILSLQAAMLAQNVALKTTLLSVEPNPNLEEKGDKIATLRINQSDGSERIVRVKTDAVWNATGLGEANYGFTLEGSRAEQVLGQTRDLPGFPKLSTTLEAFQSLAKRTGEKESPGKTIVLLGSGNSTDVLIEFVGRIFENNNPNISEVTRIYFLGESDPSQRPRYAAIRDLRARNGGENLVEQVRNRVSDIGFATNEGDPQDRQLVLYDRAGNVITDRAGNPIIADSVISAAGFKSGLDSIYSAYLQGRSIRDVGENAPLTPLTLPTNPDVAVGEYFVADPNILFLGVAAKPRFTTEKFAQLPIEASAALRRNGAENAVAIGFRAIDAQAEANIWLNSRNINLEEAEESSLPSIPLKGENGVSTQITVDRIISAEEARVPDNIKEEDLLLSPLAAYNISTMFQLEDNFSGNVDFGLTYDAFSEKFIVNFNGGDTEGLSGEFLNGVNRVLQDKYFQKYALSALSKRRRNPKLDLNLAFKRGKVNPADTYVQAS